MTGTPITPPIEVTVDFSPYQLLIVLLIVLVVFGAKRLPEIGRSLGSSAREFKEGITGQGGADDTAIDPPAKRTETRDAEQS